MELEPAGTYLGLETTTAHKSLKKKNPHPVDVTFDIDLNTSMIKRCYLL